MENIQSLAEYIEKVLGINTMTMFSNNTNSLALYRGQADKSWGLVPKVYRNNRFVNESALIAEFERMKPDEFCGLSNIEKLIKMQHYGLPTRLLDFSENPLIALYFACDSAENIDKDGAVYFLGGTPVFNQDHIAIAIIAKAIFEQGHHIHMNSFIASLREDPNIHQTNFTEKEIIEMLTITTFGIRPKLHNQRIRQQSGAFLMFGMEYKSKDRFFHNFSELKPKKIEDIWKASRTFIIPASKKEQILAELDRVGINKSTIYPELEHVAQYIDEHIAKNNFTHMGSL